MNQFIDNQEKAGFNICYDHSVGVAPIIWYFIHDDAQTIAGLLHDIATPAFAHVVDFMRGDSLKQEATEQGAEKNISSS